MYYDHTVSWRLGFVLLFVPTIKIFQ